MSWRKIVSSLYGYAGKRFPRNKDRILNLTGVTLISLGSIVGFLKCSPKSILISWNTIFYCT